MTKFYLYFVTDKGRGLEAVHRLQVYAAKLCVAAELVHEAVGYSCRTFSQRRDCIILSGATSEETARTEGTDGQMTMAGATAVAVDLIIVRPESLIHFVAKDIEDVRLYVSLYSLD